MLPWTERWWWLCVLPGPPAGLAAHLVTVFYFITSEGTHMYSSSIIIVVLCESLHLRRLKTSEIPKLFQSCLNIIFTTCQCSSESIKVFSFFYLDAQNTERENPEPSHSGERLWNVPSTSTGFIESNSTLNLEAKSQVDDAGSDEDLLL